MNAREEFIEHIENRTVRCARVAFGDRDADKVEFLLPVGYGIGAYGAFLNAISVEYHDGFGAQELFGHIWYTDGTWSEREEYDGSECWRHKYLPEITADLGGTIALANGPDEVDGPWAPEWKERTAPGSPIMDGTIAPANGESATPQHDKKIYGSEATLGEFCKVVEPVMEFINAHFDPHTRVIIDCTNAEILSGLATHNTMKFVKD